MSTPDFDAVLDELYRSKCMMTCSVCSFEGLVPVLAVGETCEQCHKGFLEDELHEPNFFMLLADHPRSA